MKFSCDQCGTRYSIADEKVEGKILKIRCKVCEFTMVVRGSDTKVGGSLNSMASVASSALAARPEIEWYAAIGHRQVGPLPWERLEDMFRSGDLNADSLLWNEAMADWTMAAQIAEVSNVLRDMDKAKPPPLPANPPSLPAVDLAISVSGLIEDSDSVGMGAPLADADTEHVEAPTEVSSLDSILNPQSTLIGRPTEKMVPDEDPSMVPDTEQSMGGFHGAAKIGDIETDNRLNFSDEIGVENTPPEEPSALGAAGQTHAYPPHTADSPSNDDTALLDLDALVELGEPSDSAEPPSAQPALIRDVSTRRLERSSPPVPLVADESIDDADEAPISSIIISESATSAPPLALPQVDDADVPEVTAEPMDLRADSSGFQQPEMYANDAVALSQPDDSVETVPPTSPERDVPIGRPISPDSVATKRGESAQPTVSRGLVAMACIMGMAVMFLTVHFVTKDASDEGGAITAPPVTETPVVDGAPGTTSSAEAVGDQPQQMNTPAGVSTAVRGTTSSPTVDPTPPPDNGQSPDVVADLAADTMAPAVAVVDQTPVPNTPPDRITKIRPPVGVQGPADRRVPPRKTTSKKDPKPKKKSRKKTEPSLDIDPLNLERRIVIQAPNTSENRAPSAAGSLRDRMTDSARSPARMKNIGGAQDGTTPRNRPRINRSRGPEAQLPERARAGSSKARSNSSGPISQATIDKVVQDHRKALNGCYERHLKKDPEYNPGRVKLTFTIRPNGRTESVSIGRKHEDTIMKGCLDRLVRRWRFPTFQGDPQKTSVPLVFRRSF